MISIGNLFSPSIIGINVYLDSSFRKDQATSRQYASLREDDLDWFYSNEQRVKTTTYGANGPKYSEVLNFFEHSALDKGNYVDVKDVKVVVEKQTPYHLPNQQFDDLHDKALRAFKAEGRTITKENRSLIRINRIKYGEKETELFIQQTDYKTQFVTNLVMDMQHADGKSWRQRIQEEHGFRLPPLQTSRLANNLGVGLVLVTGSGQTILPLRSDLAVSGRRWGCSSSFAAGWLERLCEKSHSLEEFLNLIVPDHLDLELAMRENIEFAPLALCREWLRGGKPELLLVGRTDLTLDHIRGNIEKAQHKEEIMQKWGKRILMTAKNADKYLLSQGLMIASEYLRKYVQTQQGNVFLSSAIRLSEI